MSKIEIGSGTEGKGKLTIPGLVQCGFFKTHAFSPRVFSLFLVLLFFQGCAGWHVYNEGRGKVAQGIQDRYQKIELVKLVDTQKDNLNAILDEELDVVRNKNALQTNLQLMAIAVSDEPIGKTLWNSKRVTNRMKLLTGGKDPATLRILVGDINNLGNLKEAVLRQERIMDGQVGNHPSSCLVPAANDNKKQERERNWNMFVSGLLQEKQDLAKLAKKRYDKKCTAYETLVEEIKTYCPGCDGKTLNNEIGIALKNLDRVKKKVESLRKQAQEQENKYRIAKRNLKKAQEELDEAIEPDDVNRLITKVEEARSVLENVSKEVIKASEKDGLATGPEIRIEAIDDILATTSSGQSKVDPNKDPDLSRSTQIVREIGSLTGEIEQFIQKKEAPTVSNLIIAKEHENFKRQYALNRIQIAQEHVNLHQAKVDALTMEMNQLLRMRDGLCHYFRHAAGIAEKIDCDSLVVTEVIAKPDAVGLEMRCGYNLGKTGQKANEKKSPALSSNGEETTQEEEVETASTERTRETAGEPTDAVSAEKVAGVLPPPEKTLAGVHCPFSKTINEALLVNSKPAKRYLYRAIAEFTNSISVASLRQEEAAYKIIHLSHEEAAETDRLAIQTWNALIATPINQLTAYHTSGVKPEEIADLIVKTLGFTAITVGVSQ